MKEIWNETKYAGTIIRKHFIPAHPSEYGRLTAEIITRESQVHITTTADYDRKTRVLLVEFSITENMEGILEPPAAIPQRVRDRHEAYYIVTARALEWLAAAVAAIPAPDSRTDEQVEADYDAANADATA